MMIDKQKLLDILTSEIESSTGCTDPGSVCLAVAVAAHTLGRRPEKIDVLVSPNIYKNGVSVGIPGTNRIGLELAAALGALLDEPERGLAILADVTGDIVQQAAAIVSDGRVHVAYGQTPEPLYVRAIVSGGGEEAQAVIRGDYSCVTEILRNGAPVMQAEGRTHGTAVYPLVEYSVQELYETTLLSGLVGRVLGGFGKVCMGLAVSLACLTTAIGIGSTGASVINEVSKGRISYKLWMGIACVVGAVFGSFGIQNIINYVTPIFLIMYPICIVLTVLGLVDKWIPNDGVYKFGVAVAGIVSVGDAILAVAPNLDGLRKVMYMIPLAEQGFSWLIPTVIAMVIGGIVYRGKPRYNYGETAVATEEAA